MKNVAFTAVVLCSFWIGCTQKETVRTDLWRAIEPRLTTTVDARDLPDSECPEIGDSAEIAARVLISWPQCIDDAIAAYERIARVDRRVWADVAAAYYVRADRQKSPVDYLSALEAADNAPDIPAAHFNRALALQKLGLYTQAIESWDAFLKMESRGEWADRARLQRSRVEPLRPEAMAAQWRRHQQQITAALQARDEKKVYELIALFPLSALQYFEGELLPQWAESRTAEDVARARVYAAALSRRLDGDRMPLDAVEAIARATPSNAAALEAGHAHYGLAQIRRSTYAVAEKFLRESGSPFAAAAEARAIGSAAASDDDSRIRDIDPALAQARAHRYLTVEAWLHSANALYEWGVGTYIHSLAAYDAAAKVFARTRDQQSSYDNLARLAGVTGLAGMHSRAFEQVVEAVRFPRLIDTRHRHTALGGASAIARVAGKPRAAMYYQEAAIRWLEAQQAAAPARERETLRYQLGVALREVADVKLDLGESGRDDLQEATKLLQGEKDVAGLRARMKLVEAKALVAADPKAAIDALGAALALGAKETNTFRARVLAQRARLYRDLGDRAQAKRDLEAALASVREEESEHLRRRQRGEWERGWSAYFARFQAAHESVVRHLVEDGELQEAFAYVERSRGYEPRDLLQKRDDTPPSFRELVAEELVKVTDIQAHLPEGTFLLEYSAFEDRTFVWIVSRDHFEMLPLPTRRETIERWRGEIQKAARQYSESRANTPLTAVYAELFAPVLDRIARLRGGRPADRLVIVPDEAMRGIPLITARNPLRNERLLHYAPISFAGSATLYVYSLLRSRALWRPQPLSILLVGEPASARARQLGLSELPYALLEIDEINRQYRGPHTMLTGTDATTHNFLLHARNHQIIHFAGHSAVDRTEPFNSVLFLATDGKDDGLLKAHQLLTDLQLHQTMLFVMSSCQSADNMPVGPEGVAPLVRPILAAGVPAVIGSLWDVDDATTQRLLVSFYREYRLSGDAAASLRKAQLAMLEKGLTGWPSVLEWGAFQLIGDTAPPQSASGMTHKKEKPP